MLRPIFSASSRTDTSLSPLSPAVTGHHNTTTAATVSTTITAAVSHIVFGDSSRNRARGAGAAAVGGTGSAGPGRGDVESSFIPARVAGDDPGGQSGGRLTDPGVPVIQAASLRVFVVMTAGRASRC